jgi:tetratricopeptide (TPR) repeat protein
MHRLLLGLLLVGCTGSATVTSGPGPARPAPPPPTPAPGPTVVVAPTAHPAYHRALADLRNATLYLRRPANAQVAWDEKRALNEINVAMAELRQAAIEDDKSSSDAGPPDTMVWGDRLHKALELVEAARRDINQEEDDRYANGLKKRALGRLDGAIKYLQEGIADSAAHPPPPPAPPPAHPAYLHALTDLREARFLLEKPDKPLVKWDENVAIREIDAAINEIKGAAIDDGKNLGDHPAPDAAWDHKGRLRRAMELLQQSARDIEQKEDNAFAKGLRNRAVKHINAAERMVREAMEDKKGGKKR